MNRIKKIIILLVIIMACSSVMAEAGVISRNTIEGGGYASPEETVTAYLNALQENDVEQMLSTFAVETFVDNYDLAKYTEFIMAYTPSIGYIPNISKYARKLNIEQRRTELTKMIRHQYLTLTGSKTAYELAGITIGFEDGQSGKELVEDIFATDDSGVLNNIEIGGFIAPEDVYYGFYDERNLNNIAKRANAYEAEEIRVVYVQLTVDGTEYVMGMDTVCYGGRWYNLTLTGFGATFLGSGSWDGGTIKLSDADFIKSPNL